jgi:hypothetical protein
MRRFAEDSGDYSLEAPPKHMNLKSSPKRNLA